MTSNVRLCNLLSEHVLIPQQESALEQRSKNNPFSPIVKILPALLIPPGSTNIVPKEARKLIDQPYKRRNASVIFSTSTGTDYRNLASLRFLVDP